ncbi:MAG: hypothetical protein R3Y61_03560 [Rikenellaceae bacterium]
MKKFFPFLCVLSLLFSVGCEDNDTYVEVDGQAPVLDIDATIQSEAGRTFVITGTITDADGIATISLVCPEIYLGKVIDIEDIYADSVVTNYALAYQFTTEADLAETDVFTIVVTVADLGGRTTSTNVTVTMDGDFTAPVFSSKPDASVTVLLLDENPSYSLKFTVTDDKGLASVVVASEALNIDQTIELDGELSYNYDETIELPDELASYEVTLVATDLFNLEVTYEMTIVVSRDLEDYSRIYLTVGDDPSVLTSDIMGIPMAVERTSEFLYTARFYNTEVNNEIYFIPQKSDLAPICIGADTEDGAVLNVASSADGVDPIILEVANTYYEIVVNTQDWTYTTTAYIPEDATLPYGNQYYWYDSDANDPYDYTLAVFGNGLEGYSWNQSGGALPLAQNPDNLYEVYADIVIGDYNDTYHTTNGGHIKFSYSIMRYDGWWNDPTGVSNIKWENAELNGLTEPEINVLGDDGGGDASDPGFEVPAHGTYRILYDSHLKRTRVYPID